MKVGPAEANQIVIRKVQAYPDGRVRYDVDSGVEAGTYFSNEPFFVHYDRDVRNVPVGKLVIPLLSNLCPVAWVTGADIFLDEVDADFYQTLLEVRESLKNLYPRLRFSGKLHAEKLTNDAPAVAPERIAAFFSGGVDSLCTFIRKESEKPYLVTVWGADIGLHQPDIWQGVKRDNEAFGAAHGCESLFITSNLHSFLNEDRLSFEFGRFTGGWWPGIQHGIGMVGLLAPLAHQLGIGLLHVPSALPPKLARSMPDGSNTTINNKIRWAGTRVQLESEELSRQGKVGLIAGYMRDIEPNLNIRVCWSNKEYGNCGRCEKCLRTIAALLAEGIRPDRAGFPYHPKESGALIKKRLPHWLPGNPLKVEYWDEIRKRSMENSRMIQSEEQEFFTWLQSMNLQSFNHKRRIRRLLKSLIPHPLFLYFKKNRSKAVSS